VSWYQKGKTNLDFTEARDSEWQWHLLGHMQVCALLQTDNHASTPPLVSHKIFTMRLFRFCHLLTFVKNFSPMFFYICAIKHVYAVVNCVQMRQRSFLLLIIDS